MYERRTRHFDRPLRIGHKYTCRRCNKKIRVPANVRISLRCPGCDCRWTETFVGP